MGMDEEAQAKTLPLLTTREHFIITEGTDVSFRTQYTQADVDKRRGLLTALAGDLPAPSSLDSAVPDGAAPIGWFASPTELVRAQLWLESQRELPGLEPVEEIVVADPGEPLDPATWTARGLHSGRRPRHSQPVVAAPARRGPNSTAIGREWETSASG